MNNNYIFKSFLISLLMIFLAGCPGQAKVPERFFLAYAQQNGSIRVSYSDDGVNWQNGNFKTSTIDEPLRGVGVAADELGVLHILMTDEPDDEINMVWGLGPAIWSNQGKSKPAHPIVSSPTVVDIGHNIFVVAYTGPNGAVTALVYDHSKRKFTVDVSPQHTSNRNVRGRPAITNMNGKLLLAWRNNNLQLFTSVGEVSNGVPVFSDPIEVPLPATTKLKGGLLSDPDVTHDQQQFYLAVIREQSGSPLHGWEASILKSSDGTNWNFQGRTLSHDVNNQTVVNIAGKSDGTMMLAAVKLNTGDIVASKFGNGQWGALSNQQVQAMFGSNKAAAMQFSLIGTGQP